MPKTRTIALAVALVALSTAAVAQTHARATHRAAPQPAPTGGYSYQSYGLDSNCRDRPFASGCDKRGQW